MPSPTPPPAERHLDALARLLRARPAGVICDLDGTLSDIVPDPTLARVALPMRRALERLRTSVDLLAVVSGRSAVSARDIVGVAGLAYVGNHGLERLEGERLRVLPEARPYLPVLKALAEDLRHALDEPGYYIEDKGASLSVHYRHVKGDPIEARRRVLTALERLSQAGDEVRRGASLLRVQEGKLVVNILPPGHTDKGVAVEALAQEHGLASALFLGDDVTDVDAMRAVRRLRDGGKCSGASLAVLSADIPQAVLEVADYTLDGVDGVRRFLEWAAEAGGR